jgi:hypothetical protein
MITSCAYRYKESSIRFFPRQFKALTEKKNKKLLVLKPQAKINIKLNHKTDLQPRLVPEETTEAVAP